MITPELEALRAEIRERRPVERPDLATRRADMDAGADRYPMPAGVTSADAEVAGRPARWHRPDGGDATRAVLYLHGGAYVTGSPESHRVLCARLAVACGAPVLALDYRLAPEHPFPAAVDDAVAAWTWLVRGGDIDPERAAIAGDSAGGGLAVAAMVALRDSGRPLPAAAALLSPWVDLACRGASHHRRVELDPMLRQEHLLEDADRYLGGADPLHPLASPVEADLSDLPPVLIQVGTDEILFDDGVLLHERLDAAGADARFDVWPDMYHVFQHDLPLAEAHDAVGKVGAFLTRHTT